jgi:flagellar biosynthesis protein FlhG
MRKKVRWPLDKFATDQAEGLRRLLGQGGLQVITVMSGQRHAGKTAAVANLAVALTRSGRDVLVLDQDAHGRGVSSALGLRPEHDLADVIARRCTLESIILSSHDDVQILPIGGGFEMLGRLSEIEKKMLDQDFSRLKKSVDVVLVDTTEDCNPAALPMGLAEAEILVVLSADAASITQSYGLVKQLSRDFGKRQFRLLINRAEGAEDAEAIARNFMHTAENFLGVSIDYLGFIPNDPLLRRSGVPHQSVVNASPIALSTQHFRSLADRLRRWPQAADKSGIGGLLQRLVQGSQLLSACRRG